MISIFFFEKLKTAENCYRERSEIIKIELNVFLNAPVIGVIYRGSDRYVSNPSLSGSLADNNRSHVLPRLNYFLLLLLFFFLFRVLMVWQMCVQNIKNWESRSLFTELSRTYTIESFFFFTWSMHTKSNL